MFFKRTEATTFQASKSFALSRRVFGVHRPAGSRRTAGPLPLYQVTDVLHDGRTVNVPAPEIASTVAGWLAELGVHSPLVEELERAVRAGDWTAAYAIGELLSVDVTFVS